MRVTRVVPGPAEQVDLEGEDLNAWLAAHYALDGAWLRLNLITALGGQITGPSGTSDDLADGVDRPLLRVLRSLSDVVLVGAASVRAEGYTLPRKAPLAIATVSGDLRGNALPDRIEPGRLLVLCPGGPAADRVHDQLGARATVVPLDGDPAADPALLLRALSARGLDRVMCEGGGALTSRLLASRLVDEFCHTTAPVVTSPGAPLTTGDVPLLAGRIRGLLLDETDRVYTRVAFPASAA